ncbi:MAG: RDD family protein [Thermoplasmata archaeon]|uniref:RDD family protein n=1 Tax=Candidatus Sysuiplasma superficiale TaxID=2823368 RepID=A0A8J7YVJ3_9ARCH|nr:RDD family protein [Candidatus Sysuiplasma superficiale]MBX8643191.1 RDD family protein [Candidatus Sysuiplasma superficiale]MCL4346724.1 RDD family protein [Candidatus Thermoplasmatota archaeon]
MPIAAEMILRNSVLRTHWLKRVAAGVVDIVTVFVPVWAVGITFGFSRLYFDIFVGIASGVCWFIYSTFAEYYYGFTLGKKIMMLRISSEKGEVMLHETAFRNISKLFWYILLPLDLLLGFFTYGDPRQRFSDRVFGTTIVSAQPASSLIKVKLRKTSFNH